MFVMEYKSFSVGVEVLLNKDNIMENVKFISCFLVMAFYAKNVNW